MLHNKKGAALLQVLLVTVVLAGMATMLLRASLSRTTTARQTRRAVSAQMLINACQAEVNALWSVKSGPIFQRDLQGCWMRCSAGVGTSCLADGESPNASREHECHITVDGIEYTVTAKFTATTPTTNGQCQLEYELTENTTTGPDVAL